MYALKQIFLLGKPGIIQMEISQKSGIISTEIQKQHIRELVTYSVASLCLNIK